MRIFKEASPRRLLVSVILAIPLGTFAVAAGPVVASAATTGGVNTGLPSSTCQATDGGLPYSPPDAGISTTALGTAPAYYELGAPEGAFLGQAPKGLMMVVHGGGWFTVGAGAVVATRPWADIWRNRGWETLNVTYSACAQSLSDVLWFHDAARALVGPHLPICAVGDSAGAQLALMAANQRSDIACVDAEGGPTDLVTLPQQQAFDASTGVADQTAGPSWVQNLAIAAFGTTGLAANSPVTAPGRARLLLATAQQDEFVPWAQAGEMAAADRAAHPHAYVDTDQLAQGTYFAFTHTDLSKGTGVSQAAYDDYLVRQLQLVAPVVAPPHTTGSVINDIRVPVMGNSSVGDEEFDTTTSSGQTSGVVSGSVDLGPGQTFEMQSCLIYYDPVKPAVSWCTQTTVDTHNATIPTSHPVPAVHGSWNDPSSGRGFAMAWTTVSYSNNGAWTQVASSMPDSSVQAGLYIP